MKAGGLQRTDSLFWFMVCHVTAKVHRISKWRAASNFCPSLREFECEDERPENIEICKYRFIFCRTVEICFHTFTTRNHNSSGR